MRIGDCECAKMDMTFNDGGRRTDDDETEFTAIERRREVRGRTERGGGFCIAMEGPDVPIVDDESQSRVAGCNA